MANNVINLDTFRAREGERISKVFTGRDRGAQVRKDSKIDEIEAANEKVILVIPDRIYSINPSFLEELLKNVVIKLGKDGFYKKFEIQSLGAYEYEAPLAEAIDRILKEHSAIG